MSAMFHRWICPKIFVLALVFSGGAGAAEFQCSLVSVPNEGASPSKTRITMANGQDIALPGYADDCEGLKVTQGSVFACTKNRRGLLNCLRFSEGATIGAASFSKAATPKGWHFALLDLMKGGETSSQAVSRGDDDAEQALPSGKVALVDGQLSIDFAATALKDVNWLEFREESASGVVVARIPGVGQRAVDAALFQPGKIYWWVIESATPRLLPAGRFSVADAPEQKRVKRLMGELATVADPVARAIAKSEWLYENGYRYDALQVLKEAKLLKTGDSAR